MIYQREKIRYFGFRKFETGDSMHNLRFIIKIKDMFFEMFLSEWKMASLSIDDQDPPEFEMVFHVVGSMTFEEVLIGCLVGDINQVLESARPMGFVEEIIHSMKSIFTNYFRTDTNTRCTVRIKREAVFQCNPFEIEFTDYVKL